MFKRAFNKFLEKEPDKPELYPYVYSIGLKGLQEKAKKDLKTEPIKCSECGAIFTNIQVNKEDPKIDVTLTCEFCEATTVFNKVQLLTQEILDILPDDIDFIIEDVVPQDPETAEQITKISAAEGELYISVIDISGSMSGSKIEAVKKSLIQTIKDFKINAAATRFLLIAFESSVYYYVRHDQDPIRFSGELLYSVDKMREGLERSIKKDVLPGSIGEFADGWVTKVEGLRSMDMTALGPALFYAISSFDLFQMQQSGRITLLTDGLANQGIGNLSGSSVGAEKYYDQMADLCNKNNIIVDVVGVSASGDNNEMGLQTLGKLTDNTGGKLFLISSDEMEAIFSELRQTNYIGKDVKIRIITPKAMGIKNVSGAFSSKNVEEAEISLGAVTADRELYVELDASKGFGGEGREEIPVQLQVEYIDSEGRKRLRVINDKVKITKDEKEFKKEYNQKLNVMMNIQQSGQSTYAGKADKSKKKLSKLRGAIKNELSEIQAMDASFGGAAFNEGMDYLDDELEEMEVEEKAVASSPKASYMAAKGQMRSRISAELKELKMKKKRENK